MKQFEPNKFLVVKNASIKKYLTETEAGILDILLFKVSCFDHENKYYVCNQDEEYAEKVLDLILER